jgi:hypothetical protein
VVIGVTVVIPGPAALVPSVSPALETHRHGMEQLNGFPGFPQNNKAMQNIKGLKMTPITTMATETSAKAIGKEPAEPLLRSRFLLAERSLRSKRMAPSQELWVMSRKDGKTLPIAPRCRS